MPRADCYGNEGEVNSKVLAHSHHSSPPLRRGEGWWFALRAPARGLRGTPQGRRPCGERRAHHSGEGCPQCNGGSARLKRRLRPTSRRRLPLERICAQYGFVFLLTQKNNIRIQRSQAMQFFRAAALKRFWVLLAGQKYHHTGRRRHQAIIKISPAGRRPQTKPSTSNSLLLGGRIDRTNRKQGGALSCRLPLFAKRSTGSFCKFSPFRSAIRYRGFRTPRSATKDAAFGNRKPFEKGLTESFYIAFAHYLPML